MFVDVVWLCCVCAFIMSGLCTGLLGQSMSTCYCILMFWCVLGAMSLLVRPHAVVVPVRMVEGVRLFRLVVGEGVRVTETVTGLGRMTLHLSVYADVLLVDTTIYHTSLMVVRLSVYVDMLCLCLCDIGFFFFIFLFFYRLARTGNH